jgi:hypothetical protein
MYISMMRLGLAIREPRSSPPLPRLVPDKTSAGDGFAAIREVGMPDNRSHGHDAA